MAKKVKVVEEQAQVYVPPDPLFVLLSSETLVLSREEGIKKAREHASLPSSPTERDKKRLQIKHLAEAMRNRCFLPCCWATVLHQGVVYRMNGQHSSSTILEVAEALPEALPEKLVIHLDNYRADTPNGMGLLFRQFDARWSSRSTAEVAGAYQGLVTDLRGVKRETVKLGIEGVEWHSRCVETTPFPRGDDRFQHILNAVYQPFLCWLAGILNAKSPELMHEAIVAAMYATHIKSESLAQEFWYQVAKPQDMFNDNDPRNVLSRELVKIYEDKKESKKSRTRVTPVGPGDLFAKCIKAWNAWRSGKDISSLEVNARKGLPAVAA